MRFNDRIAVGDIKETSEGYLVATARVARTGIQYYLASELGDIAISEGFQPSDVVSVLRHSDEVFNEDSLNSITRLPVTIDHPSESVTADNWASLSVGEVGDAYSKEPEWIVVNPMIKDSKGVEAAKTTHREISMGYVASIVKARDGSGADFEQKRIRYNHLALVPKGRAGKEARIGDSWGLTPVQDYKPGAKPKTTEGGRMTTKTVVLGDKAVQVLTEDAAEVERFKDSAAQALKDAEANHEKAIATKDAELAKVQAQLDDAKTKILSEDDIDKRVADRANLVAVAKSIVPDLKTEGVKDADIRKATVVSKLGEEAVKDKSAAYIDARFDILAEDSHEENPVRSAFSKGVTTTDDSINDAHNDYVARLTRRNKKEA